MHMIIGHVAGNSSWNKNDGDLDGEPDTTWSWLQDQGFK